MELPSIIVANRRPPLVPEIIIPARRFEPMRVLATRRSDREHPVGERRWTAPLRGLLVDVYA
jgi:hypothetical protein